MSGNIWTTSFENIDKFTSWSTFGSAGVSPASTNSGSADGLSASVLFSHSDQFNVRGLTNLSGNIVELYSYTPYGKQTILTATGTEINESAYNNCYGYTGRYLDEETGLWYFRARYFDNELGRFISRDPLGFVDGLLSISASSFLKKSQKFIA